MAANKFAAHETLELHELLASTTTSFTVCNNIKNQIEDKKLANIINEQSAVCERHIQDMQKLLKRSAFN